MRFFFQVKKLKLPRSVVNIRIKLNQSNPCIMVPSVGYLIAGVRRDVFVWNWDKEQLLRSFMGHMGRILDMRALITHNQKLFLTSSADKTIKAQCLKITQNVAFSIASEAKMVNFGIFRGFLPFKIELSGNSFDIKLQVF